MTAAFVGSFAGVFGLAIGSFLNVVAYRVPNGLSVVKPASACPGCGAEIQRRDNVPVLSWLLLRGRCRNCSMSISVRYPIVEAITGLAFVLVALLFAPAIASAQGGLELAASLVTLVAFLYLAAISVVLAVIDLDVHRLPDRIVLPAYLVSGILLTTAALLSGDPARLAVAAIGGGAMLVFYGLLFIVYPAGMGLGDVKLAGVLGLFLGFLGWPQLAVGAAAAFVLGGVFAIVLLATGRARRGTGIPFGPWMIVGAWIGIVAGEQIAAGYLELVGLG
jgi:leader peptidase (prepilin peptidase)/N-methyltransferase